MIVKDPFNRMVSQFLHERQCRIRRVQKYEKQGKKFEDTTLGKNILSYYAYPVNQIKIFTVD